MDTPSLDHLFLIWTPTERNLALEYDYLNLAIEAIAMIQFSEEIALPEASLIQYEDIDPFDLTDIRIGLLMIYSGRGLTKERPFVQLGIHAMNVLMMIFGYKLVIQRIEEKKPEGIIDCLNYQNKDGKNIVLFNLVANDHEPSNSYHFDFSKLSDN